MPQPAADTITRHGVPDRPGNDKADPHGRRRYLGGAHEVHDNTTAAGPTAGPDGGGELVATPQTMPDREHNSLCPDL
jgi:hypothetical protein